MKYFYIEILFIITKLLLEDGVNQVCFFVKMQLDSTSTVIHVRKVYIFASKVSFAYSSTKFSSIFQFPSTRELQFTQPFAMRWYLWNQFAFSSRMFLQVCKNFVAVPRCAHNLLINPQLIFLYEIQKLSGIISNYEWSFFRLNCQLFSLSLTSSVGVSWTTFVNDVSEELKNERSALSQSNQTNFDPTWIRCPNVTIGMHSIMD